MALEINPYLVTVQRQQIICIFVCVCVCVRMRRGGVMFYKEKLTLTLLCNITSTFFGLVRRTLAVCVCVCVGRERARDTQKVYSNCYCILPGVHVLIHI